AAIPAGGSVAAAARAGRALGAEEHAAAPGARGTQRGDAVASGAAARRPRGAAAARDEAIVLEAVPARAPGARAAAAAAAAAAFAAGVAGASGARAPGPAADAEAVERDGAGGNEEKDALRLERRRRVRGGAVVQRAAAHDDG